MSQSLRYLMKSENMSLTRTFSHKVHSLICLLIWIFSVFHMSMLWWLRVSTWIKICECASWATGARVSPCFIMITWWVPWLHLGTDHKAAVLHLFSETLCSPSLLWLFTHNTQWKKEKYDVNKLTKGLIRLNMYWLSFFLLFCSAPPGGWMCPLLRTQQSWQWTIKSIFSLIVLHFILSKHVLNMLNK